MKKAKTYKFQWKTAEEIFENRKERMFFPCWGTGTLEEMLGEMSFEDYKNAHELWLKLEEAFNKEAETYEPEAYNSNLGSVGEVERREVCRPNWFYELDGDKYGEYGTMTSIIELLHHGEQLKTGKILFGS